MNTEERFYHLVVRAIEYIIAIVTIVSGVYVLSPFLTLSTSINGPSPLIATLGSTLAVHIYGVFLLIAGFLLLYGLIKHKNWPCRQGLLIIALTRLYGVFGAIIVIGILPLTWLPTFTVFLIVSVLWWARGKS